MLHTRKVEGVLDFCSLASRYRARQAVVTGTNVVVISYKLTDLIESTHLYQTLPSFLSCFIFLTEIAARF